MKGKNKSTNPENAKLCKSVNEDQIPFFFFFDDLSWKEFGELVSDLQNGLCVVILDKYLSFLTLVLMDEISTMTDRSEVD